MHTPRQYIAAAVKGLRRLMPESTTVMWHGEYTGVATCVGSVSKGEDALEGSEPVEAQRVLVSVSDFPALAKGAIVMLGCGYRLVVGAARDPSAALLSVGLSAEFSDKFAFSGKRREADGTVRNIRLPVDGLATLRNDPDEWGAAPAPNRKRVWGVCIPFGAWTEKTPPCIDDEVAFNPRDGVEEVSCRAASVEERTGYWYVVLREREAKW